MLRQAIGRTARGLGLRSSRENILRRVPTAAVCAEIGVFRGQFTRHIVRITRPAELHLIDCWWTGCGEHYPDWGAYTDHGCLTTRQAYEEARAAAPAAIVHVGDDVAILGSLPNRYFDWMYLDTSHTYDQTVRELQVITRKLKSGGLLLGDDWHDDPKHPHAGVAQAVCEACGRGEWTLLAPGDRFAQWAARLR